MSASKHDADKLPPEVQLRLVKNRAAEQDRYLTLARIADALEEINKTLQVKPPKPNEPIRFTLRELLRSWVKQLLR
jgi:hypothetical protein